MQAAYPRPTHRLTIPPLHPRSIPPPVPSDKLPAQLPSLISPPRPSPFPAYELRTHLTPCARPRASPTATSRSTRLRPSYPPVTIHDLSLGARQSRANVDDLHQWMLDQGSALLHERVWEDASEDEPLLWNKLNLFQRKHRLTDECCVRPKITLFFVQGNGFPKEIWETVIARLLQLYPEIDELILFEPVHQGESAVINSAGFGDTIDWTDSARDVLQFLMFHRPLDSSQTLPTHLTSHEAETTPRPVIGIGHSLGGSIITRAALSNPSLFSALILLDAMIKPDYLSYVSDLENERYDALAKMALARRCVWSSPQEARESFSRSPFFQTWDASVQELYIRHGITAIHTHPVGKHLSANFSPDAVMLKQSPYDEAMTYLYLLGPSETYYLLHTLPREVELRWIMNGQDAQATGGEDYNQHTVWQRPENCSNVRVLEAGHLMVQEAPYRVAGEIAIVLEKRFGPSGSISEVQDSGLRSRM